MPLAPSRLISVAGSLALAALVSGCAGNKPAAPSQVQMTSTAAPDYRIGPLDTVQVFVWQAPEFSVTVPVRPDGRISTPLIEDLVAAGKTPTELARDIEERLKLYVTDPLATVMVSNFAGPFDQQVRVVGQAMKPAAVPYRANMTVLDLLIQVGGLTEFAAGNRAVLARAGNSQTFNVRLDDLLRDGDISANVPVLPGDVVIIPQSWF
ncbi:XrtA/PEP-CTERM system exopolysaccharide export protein [Arenibaculum pallidiluteum]|uniref:XrtA/PEP-CTERM system exopolysaccharide export protein n=1 Tax=Arenibaculum pallidiluteum TaxID=2812559 RepID=UPI001A97C8CC|nr:XrtA/PEP-CTERM system exopolysaccharide export protein [Arenibaculum pallidiluteum]